MFRFAALVAACLATAANAHMSVNPRTVPDDGSYYRVAMRVPHGCGVGEGDARVYYPTRKVEVIVPPEIALESTARGEWVPFWPLTVEDMDDGSRKMSWEAEDMKHHLGADMFKEFGITMKVPAMDAETAPEDGVFMFTSKQYCEEGNEAPWEGEDAPTLKYETIAAMDTDGHGHGSHSPAAGADTCNCCCPDGHMDGTYGEH